MPIDWLRAAETSARYLVDNPTILAAAIAGVVAIVATRTTLHGVKLSLSASEAKTKAELAHSVDQENRNREHTRTEAARERELDARKERHARLIGMRRDVYLNAIAEAIRFHGVLGDLPRFDFAKGDSRELMEDFAIAINRVAIVAEQSTAICAKQTHGEYMKLFLRCIMRVARIAQMRNRLDELDRLVAGVQARRDSYVESMREFNLAQRNDAGAFRAIQVQLEINEREGSQLALEQSRLSQQRLIAQNAYSDYIVKEVREKISGQLDLLTVAMRTELELSSELAVFQALTVDTNNQVAEIMTEIRAGMAGDHANGPP